MFFRPDKSSITQHSIHNCRYVHWLLYIIFIIIYYIIYVHKFGPIYVLCTCVWKYFFFPFWFHICLWMRHDTMTYVRRRERWEKNNAVGSVSRRGIFLPARRTKTNKLLLYIAGRVEGVRRDLQQRRNRTTSAILSVVYFPQWPKSTGFDSIMTRLNRASTCTVIWPLTALRFPCCMAAGCSPADKTNKTRKRIIIEMHVHDSYITQHKSTQIIFAQADNIFFQTTIVLKRPKVNHAKCYVITYYSSTAVS